MIAGESLILGSWAITDAAMLHDIEETIGLASEPLLTRIRQRLESPLEDEDEYRLAVRQVDAEYPLDDECSPIHFPTDKLVMEDSEETPFEYRLDKRILEKIPNIDEGTLRLISDFLGSIFKWDPSSRASHDDLLMHPWLSDVPDIDTKCNQYDTITEDWNEKDRLEDESSDTLNWSNSRGIGVGREEMYYARRKKELLETIRDCYI
jgi:serine/threonine protein kinase